MSLKIIKTKIFQEVFQSEEKNNNNILIKNYQLNAINYRNQFKGNDNIKTDTNFHFIKIKKTANNYNMGYNTERTDYSSHINECLSDLHTKSEIRPLYSYIKLIENNKL